MVSCCWLFWVRDLKFNSSLYKSFGINCKHLPVSLLCPLAEEIFIKLVICVAITFPTLGSTAPSQSRYITLLLPKGRNDMVSNQTQGTWLNTITGFGIPDSLVHQWNSLVVTMLKPINIGKEQTFYLKYQINYLQSNQHIKLWNGERSCWKK